jgi:hypothetical protein
MGTMKTEFRMRAIMFASALLVSSVGLLRAQGSTDGIWISQGYGYAFVIGPDSLASFEVTTTTCVPSWRATRVSPRPNESGRTYRRTDAPVVFTVGSDPVGRRLKSEGAASHIVLLRATDLPAHCAKPTPNTPQGNFDVFATTWAEHYILFDEKGVNWSRVVADARRRVNTNTTPDQLFEIFRGMIAPFEDAHTSISAPSINKRFSGFRRGTDGVIPGGRDSLSKMGVRTFITDVYPRITKATDAYLTGPLRSWCEGIVRFGMLNDTTGYLRILGFSGYSKTPGFAASRAALQTALDEIFATKRMRGLVIDVRINFGGSDVLALDVAARLTGVPYMAYAKSARSLPTDKSKWTPNQPVPVVPSTRASFYGPVVILTGPLTISAGETFTQALMGRTPAVPRIGENTQGVFSDVLPRRLPNGWTFGLPNEVFRTQTGATFDGPGIPPTIGVPVFADADRAAGRDVALNRALVELSKPRR